MKLKEYQTKRLRITSIKQKRQSFFDCLLNISISITYLVTEIGVNFVKLMP